MLSSCTTIPREIPGLSAELRDVFGPETFATFAALTTGMLRARGDGTVTEMWSGAGLAGRVHWSRAHRFFAGARWDPDELGLALARMVVARFVPVGPVVVVVDDTLFHRAGRKVFGALWQHDGSALGRYGLGRGNGFVVVGIAVTVPWMNRRVLLPVLVWLWRGKGTATRAELARQMVDLLVREFPKRDVDVVADAGYAGKVWAGLPERVTVTFRLPARAALYAPPPLNLTVKAGHPVWKGPKLPSLGELAGIAAWQTREVTRYGRTVTVQIAEMHVLWWGPLRRTPTRLILLRDLGTKTGYDLALLTTDTMETIADLVDRYSWRWSIEQAFHDAESLLGVGRARSRVQKAVERTVPFQLFCLTILFCWYHDATRAGTITPAWHRIAPWYRHKTHISTRDMIDTFREAIDHTPVAPAPAINPTTPAQSTCHLPLAPQVSPVLYAPQVSPVL